MKESKDIKIKAFLKKNNKESGAPFSCCYFGNTVTGEKKFIGDGNGRVSKKINKKMYHRLASLTKLLGMVNLALALENGIIESLDDPVYKYIPEIEKINSWVSGATPVLNEQDVQTYDKYGTPCFKAEITIEEGLGKKITLRNCLECSSGLGYFFPALGFQRNLMNAYAPTESGQKYIAWVQGIENLNTQADIASSEYFKHDLTYTESILQRFDLPLLYYPGTDNIYDNGITIINAAIGKSLQMKGICKTSAEYFKENILDKMCIKKLWLGAGSLNPPKDVDEYLTESFFVRDSYVDEQAGPNVKLNTLYGVFDKEAQGDGFVFQSIKGAIRKKNNNSCITDPLAGGFDSSGLGTFGDFSSFMMLIIDGGYCKKTKKRIISKQSVEWIITPKIYNLTLFGKGTYSVLENGSAWCGGFSRYTVNSTNIPFGCGTNTITWGGYYGNTYIFDISTGNYLISGTQVPQCSWYLSGKFPPPYYQPNSVELWRLTL